MSDTSGGRVALTDAFFHASLPLWQLRMQSVCHECRCALWTCVEDCKDGSLGTSSDSHALLLNEGQ